MKDHSSSKPDSTGEGVHGLEDSAVPLFLSGELREVAEVMSRLCTDEKCREKFWKDPAEALAEAGIKASPKAINIIRKADRAIVDKIVGESRNILNRSEAFTWEGEKVAFVPLAAAFLAGALVAEALHHHKVEI